MGVLPTTASLAHRFQFFDVLPDAFAVSILLIKPGDTCKKDNKAMDLSKIGQMLSDWIDEEWYMGFFIIFSVIFILMMIKMTKEISSSKRFPKSKDDQNGDENLKG